MKLKLRAEAQRKKYFRAVSRLWGQNHGPNKLKDARETAEAMHQLADFAGLFLIGLGASYQAKDIAISLNSETGRWVVSYTTEDGDRFHMDAESLDEAALFLGEQMMSNGK